MVCGFGRPRGLKGSDSDFGRTSSCNCRRNLDQILHHGLEHTFYKHGWIIAAAHSSESLFTTCFSSHICALQKTVVPKNRLVTSRSQKIGFFSALVSTRLFPAQCEEHRKRKSLVKPQVHICAWIFAHDATLLRAELTFGRTVFCAMSRFAALVTGRVGLMRFWSVIRVWKIGSVRPIDWMVLLRLLLLLLILLLTAIRILVDIVVLNIIS